MYKHHIVICGLYGSTIFFHIISLTAGLFKKKKLNMKSVFISSTSFVLYETFFILIRSERDLIKNICLHVNTCYSCQILMKLEFFLTDFWKILKSQISWKSTPWEPSCSKWADSWTDRHDTANSHFLQLCKHLKTNQFLFWDRYKMH
jgi:putative component of membrane protein insertase Oxa1/YidC/SpoIIIJ protein YidD